MSNEQWLEDGDCSKCRRRDYCKKRCKKSRVALQHTISDLFAKAMVKQLSKVQESDDVVVTSESAQAQYLEKQLEK